MTCRDACNATEHRSTAVELGLEHGFAFTPLRGKKPFLKGWVSAPVPSREEAMEWAKQGNIGLRTGRISGVVVVDAEAGADLTALDLPVTVEVITGRGGRHFYFKAPPYLTGNSTGRIAPLVDFKGDGGQVVYPGSIHPDTRTMYRWAAGRALDEVLIAPLPDTLAHLVRKSPAKVGRQTNNAGLGKPQSTPYGRAALKGEEHRVSMAAEGERNNTLNRSAFAVAQLCAKGHLPEEETRARLLDATGLDATEASRTIESGFRAGLLQPRGPSLPAVGLTQRATRDATEAEILVPGQHLDDEQRVIEISNHDFADAVLRKLPPNTLTRRGGVPGELVGRSGERRFEVCTVDQGRLKIDEHVRLMRWGGRKQRELQYVACSKNHAGLVLAAATKHDSVRELVLLVPFPAIGCQPGWNDGGIYFDANDAVRDIKPTLDREEIKATLDDFLIDFPFREEASRQNVIGLLLTPLVRPMIDGNVPFHLITSPMERTGKTLLVEGGIGGILLGRPTPALQFSSNEEEQEKRVTSILLQSNTVVHLDNLRGVLDSAPLASLLTSRVWQGRLLGMNRMVTIPNHTILIGTGNNVRMTSELAKRTVPVILQPKTDVPEDRTGFVHADIGKYALENRRGVLSCLLGGFELWRKEGRPTGGARLGGFDAWAAVVGGVMETMGYDQWLANRRAWLRDADPDGNDLAELVSAWSRLLGNDPVPASQLLALTDELELFQGTISGRDPKQRVASFSRTVLSRNKDRPVGSHLIRHKRTQYGGRWYLQPSQAGGVTT